MLQPRFQLTTLAASVCAMVASSTAWAADPVLAPWLVQMGLNSSILSAAKWGAGQKLAVVDTGIVLNHPQFGSGQVSASLSSCAGVTFACRAGVTDDNGHGTAVASIAAGNRLSGPLSYGGYTVAAGSYIGVAPNANIIALKSLNAMGSGYSTDVVNGINKASASGASVINLSLTYMPSPDVVAAVNTAASRGSFIVWAGGNESTPLNFSTVGLSPEALKRIVFVGALDTTAAKSASFSNTPGGGTITTTNGMRTGYASRWITAPGVNILAPNIAGGNSAMSFWSGTSMSAPLVSGSLILLQSAWPILRTNGSAADLLLATATDLGTKGVDSQYGNGLVNLNKAFQPYGALSVVQANGKTLPVTSVTGSLINGGALGTLASVKAKLASYAATDTYQRNFTVNLSGLILAKPVAASLNPLPVNTNTGVTPIRLANGELSQWSGESGQWLMSYSQRSGQLLAMAQGGSGKRALGQALSGDNRLAAVADDLAQQLDAGTGEGAYQLAYGVKWDDDTRLAVAANQSVLGESQYASHSQMLVGLQRKLNPQWHTSLTAGWIQENQGLLGSQNNADSLLAVGKNHTATLAWSMAYQPARHTTVVGEIKWAHTQSTQGNSLLADTSALESRAVGVSLQQQAVWQDDDVLSLSVSQPLRVEKGTATLVMPSFDDEGVAHYNRESVSLVPSARQTDLSVKYNRPIGRLQQLQWQATYQNNLQHEANSRNTSVGMSWNQRF